MVENAKSTGTDRVELYTESFAKDFEKDRDAAILPFIEAAIAANELGIGLNAGHDLNLKNLKFFAQRIPGLLEVSIGHALICDALYLGLDNAIKMYLRELRAK
jgi:pyridoxine 5-phosphate synthase